MTRNFDTVQGIYQAFGQGDVPGILATLSPHIQWEAWPDNSLQSAGHPLFAPRRDPQGVGEFFRLVGENLALHEFKVLDIFGDGQQVAAEVVIDYTWKPTARRVRDEELHLWTFGEDGKVTRFRHYIDTAKHLRAAGLLAA